MMSLYSCSLYFTIQTVTTVGYGDMNINTSYEKVVCIIMQLIGVITFSMAAGVLTALISDYDKTVSQN